MVHRPESNTPHLVNTPSICRRHPYITAALWTIATAVLTVALYRFCGFKISMIGGGAWAGASGVAILGCCLKNRARPTPPEPHAQHRRIERTRTASLEPPAKREPLPTPPKPSITPQSVTEPERKREAEKKEELEIYEGPPTIEGLEEWVKTHDIPYYKGILALQKAQRDKDSDTEIPHYQEAIHHFEEGDKAGDLDATLQLARLRDPISHGKDIPNVTNHVMAPKIYWELFENKEAPAHLTYEAGHALFKIYQASFNKHELDDKKDCNEPESYKHFTDLIESFCPLHARVETFEDAFKQSRIRTTAKLSELEIADMWICCGNVYRLAFREPKIGRSYILQAQSSYRKATAIFRELEAVKSDDRRLNTMIRCRHLAVQIEIQHIRLIQEPGRSLVKDKRQIAIDGRLAWSVLASTCLSKDHPEEYLRIQFYAIDRALTRQEENRPKNENKFIIARLEALKDEIQVEKLPPAYQVLYHYFCYRRDQLILKTEGHDERIAETAEDSLLKAINQKFILKFTYTLKEPSHPLRHFPMEKLDFAAGEYHMQSGDAQTALWHYRDAEDVIKEANERIDEILMGADTVEFTQANVLYAMEYYLKKNMAVKAMNCCEQARAYGINDSMINVIVIQHLKKPPNDLLSAILHTKD